MYIVYLNGNFLPLQEARISVLDRGFLFGDAVYEVIPSYNGKLLRLEQHLERLQYSLQQIDIAMPFAYTKWHDILRELIERNMAISHPHQFIYIQISRGAGENRQHQIPPDIKPTVFVQCTSLKHYPDENIQNGYNAITMDDIRWSRCDIKAVTLLPNVLMLKHAKSAGCEEAILIRNGQALEGTATNIFIVKDGIIITPPLQKFILAGITRSLVLELAKKHNLPAVEKEIPLELLHSADEIWITSSSRGIHPIVKLNESLVGTGKPGKIWQEIYSNYQKYIEEI